MADNFNLRTFLSENKLTKNAQLLKEQQEDYKYFDEEGVGGFYLGQVKGITIYSLEDSSVMDTCMYALEGPQGVNFIDIDVAGEPISPPEILKQHQLPFEIAQFIADDIDRELGEEGIYDEEEEEDLDEGSYSDSYDTPAAKKVGGQLQSAIHDVRSRSQIDPTIDKLIAAAEQETGSQVTSSEKRILSSQGYHIYSMNAEMEREGTENKKPMMKETKLTAKERRLVEMVNNAMGFSEGEENVDYTMGRQDDPNQLPNPAPELNIPEGDEMADETVIPEYHSIDELMKSIDHGTNKVAEEHKIQEMKKIAQMLREKAKKMEESEHAAHISPKDLKQLATDAAKLEKAAEKLKSAFDKKFNKKEKAPAAPKAEKVEALQENKNNMENFDLKKFLIENKMTRNSRMVSEEEQVDELFGFGGPTEGDLVAVSYDDGEREYGVVGPKGNQGFKILYTGEKQSTQASNSGVSKIGDPKGGTTKDGQREKTAPKVTNIQYANPKKVGFEGNPKNPKEVWEFFNTNWSKFSK